MYNTVRAAIMKTKSRVVNMFCLLAGTTFIGMKYNTCDRLINALLCVHVVL